MRPTSLEELADIVARARADRLTLVARGGGTKLELGAPLERLDLVVDTSGLRGIVEWAPENLTATVLAGTTLAEVQRELAARGQLLPIDPPLPERATIGGILAAGANGGLRLRFGPARDLLIGTVVASGAGKLVRSGGRVVKNVAGYDLNKLFVGSLGTLGVLGQATFKVAPLPERQAAALAFFADPGAAWAAVRALRASPLGAWSIELAAPETAAALGDPWARGSWVVATRFGGVRAAVERALGEAARICAEAGATSTELHDIGSDAAEPDPLWRPLRDHGAVAALRLRVGARASDAATVASRIREAAPALELRAHAANAVLFASAERMGDEDAVAAVRTIRGALAGTITNVVVERAPLAARRALGPDGLWGPPGADVEVMRRLKLTFDPDRVLSVGRYVGGI